MKEILTTLFIIIVVILITIGSFYVKRKINYSLMYKDMVRQTISEMVKPECLILSKDK